MVAEALLLTIKQYPLYLSYNLTSLYYKRDIVDIALLLEVKPLQPLST
jgi:hypothetical protein